MKREEGEGDRKGRKGEGGEGGGKGKGETRKGAGRKGEGGKKEEGGGGGRRGGGGKKNGKGGKGRRGGEGEGAGKGKGKEEEGRRGGGDGGGGKDGGEEGGRGGEGGGEKGGEKKERMARPTPALQPFPKSVQSRVIQKLLQGHQRRRACEVSGLRGCPPGPAAGRPRDPPWFRRISGRPTCPSAGRHEKPRVEPPRHAHRRDPVGPGRQRESMSVSVVSTSVRNQPCAAFCKAPFAGPLQACIG